MSDELTLTKRKLGKTMAVSREMLQDPDIDIDNYLAGLVRVEINGFLWAQDVGETRVEWPANWFEHLKSALGLRYKKAGKTISFRAYYPEFRHESNLGPVSLRADPEWEPE